MIQDIYQVFSVALFRLMDIESPRNTSRTHRNVSVMYDGVRFFRSHDDDDDDDDTTTTTTTNTLDIN